MIQNLEEYTQETLQRIERGKWPHPPEGREQLVWLVETYPDYAVVFLPPKSEMWHLDLPADFGRPIVLSQRERAQILETLYSEADFARAAARLMKEAVRGRA